MTDVTPLLPDGIFDGRTAFVTGGGTGLGLAVSLRLGRLGAQVVVASRNTEHHADIKRLGDEHGFRVHPIVMDVRDAHAVKDAFQETKEAFGGLDLLVNNAAGNFIRPSLLLAPKGFATVIDIALNGVFNCSREAGRMMRATGGAIVNISAPYSTTGRPGVVHSASAKAGVDALTKSLAAEWATHGIRVNAVSPGPFVSQGAADRLWPSPEIEEEVRRQIPLGRFGTTEEVAELVCLLGSPAVPWITGTILLADGGWSLPGALVEGLDGRESVERVDRRRDDPDRPPAS